MAYGLEDLALMHDNALTPKSTYKQGELRWDKKE